MNSVVIGENAVVSVPDNNSCMRLFFAKILRYKIYRFCGKNLILLK